MRLRRARAARAARPTLIAESDPRSDASEAYRTIRTNIQFAGLDRPCRTIVITSGTAGEGKTTSVANFGVVCAQAGSRVCLVDSDLRRPALHRLFGTVGHEVLRRVAEQIEAVKGKILGVLLNSVDLSRDGYYYAYYRHYETYTNGGGQQP